MRAPERELARRLARVLDGEERGDGETAALAALLERAAESVRLDVPEAEIERALVRARPALGRGRSPRRAWTPRRPARRAALALAGAVAAVGAAVGLAVAWPFGSLDVAAEAEAALAADDVVLSVVERIVPVEPGTFDESTRTGWLDLEGGRARWTQEVSGRIVAETLVEPGSVRHFLPQQDAVIVGPSCAAFPGGCADLVDPIALYRDALVGSPEPAVTETADGRSKAYEIVLPVQMLPDGARIEQVVTVEAETYLPRRIVWRDVTAEGEPRPFAVIEIERLSLVPRDELPAGAFALELPAGVRVVERRPAGEIEGERPLGVDEAQALEPPISWLGPEYAGFRLEAIDEVRLDGGLAYRLRYGEIVVWNYTTAAPAEIAEGQVGPVKTVPFDGGTARFTSPEGGPIIAELERADGSVAVVAPALTKLDVFGALEALRPLR